MENNSTPPTHTEGPWTVAIHDGEYGTYRVEQVRDRCDELMLCENDDEMEDVLASIGQLEEANARLIAAAPELLDACRAAVDALNQIPNTGINSGTHRNTYSVCSTLDAAIARATTPESHA